MGLTNQQLTDAADSINRKQFKTFYKWTEVATELKEASDCVGKAIHHTKNALAILNKTGSQNTVMAGMTANMVDSLANFARELRGNFKQATGYANNAEQPQRPSKVVER